MIGRRLKLALFTPLSPVPTGISAYMEELLPALGDLAQIDIFIDDYSPSNRAITERFNVFNFRSYVEHDRREQYDLTLYQMGNNPFHKYCLPFLISSPGVIVLHDLVLHHLIADATLVDGQPEQYVREMRFAHGSVGEQIARDVIESHRPVPFFEFPLFERTVRSSLGVLGHSQHLLQGVGARFPWMASALVPMGIPLPPLARSAAETRRSLSIAEDAFVVASFGEATPHKRLAEALRAFAQFHRQHPQSLYVIVGNLSPALDIMGMARSLRIESAVRVTGFAARELFDSYMQVADVSLNLRYPTAGETSASALRCLAAGKATIVSALGANREIPEEVCFKVPVGGEEEIAEIAALLRRLACSGEGAKVGARAREFIAKRHTIERAARTYVSFAEQVVAGTAVPYRPLPLNDYRLNVLVEISSQLADVGLRPNDATTLGVVSRALFDVVG